MKIFTRKIYQPAFLFMFVLVLAASPLAAQTGSGSNTSDNSYRASEVTETTYEYAETLYIGPGAVWNIKGTHIVYSRFIWIAPGAQIAGTGKLVIANPGDNPFYIDMPAGPTIIDGNNGNLINLQILHQNPGNVLLADITDPGYGTVNPSGVQSATLKVGANFSFNIDNGDILLNGHDLVFGSDATISNYSVNRMVVTGNSIIGHIVKENTVASTFVFPVGIAEADYTPAIITGNENYHVSVTNYTATNAIIQVPPEGMDRTWHIYGGAATGITLQHNSPSTDGTLYFDDVAFITRYQGYGNWSSEAVTDYVSTGVHTNSSTAPAGIPVTGTADAAWFSKASDNLTPLPVKLTGFRASKKNTTVLLEWSTASEQNNKGFGIERSADGIRWETTGFVYSLAVNGNSSLTVNYDFTDTKPMKGINYYRLIQTDIDSKKTYSEIRQVKFDHDRVIVIAPNPATRYATINGIIAGDMIYLYNATGQQLQVTKAVANSYTADVSHLPPGVYFIVITDPWGIKLTHEKLTKK